MGSGKESSVHPLHEKKTNFYPTLERNWGNLCGTVALYMTLLFSTTPLTSCSGDDPVIDNSKPNPNEKPSEQYEYTRKVSSLTVEDGTFIKVDRTGNPNKVLVGSTVVFEFRGNLSIMFGGNIINGEFEITEPGDLYLCRGSDIVGEPCKIIVEKKGPEVSVLKDTINVFGGVAAEINTNSLKLGNAVVMEWPDGCKVEISFIDGSGNKKVIQNGDMLLDSGALAFYVEKDGKSTEKRVNLVCESIKGLNELANKFNQKVHVGDVVNFRKGITCGHDIEISSIYLDQNGNEYSVDNPENYEIPYTGTYHIGVKFVNTNSGQSYNALSDSSFEVEARAYKAPEFQKVNPKDYWPILDKLQLTDKQRNKYNYIVENLNKIGYAIGIKNLLKKYGTEGHTPEECEEKLKTIRICIIWETVEGYPYIGGKPKNGTSSHALEVLDHLKTILGDDVVVFIVNPTKKNETDPNPLEAFYIEAGNNPDYFYFGGLAIVATVSRDKFDSWPKNRKEPSKNTKNACVDIAAGTPTDGCLKLYSEDIPNKTDGVYSYGSSANYSDGLVVVSGTGPADRSLYGVGFNDKSIIGGTHGPDSNGDVNLENSTSDLAYSTLAAKVLATKLYMLGTRKEKLEVNDVLDVLWQNSDTTSIRLDNETQALKLTNPLGVAESYLMPKISEEIYFAGDEVRLEKTCPFNVCSGVGIVAVPNNGEKIPVTAENFEYLKQFNPKDVEYYYSPSLLEEYGYAPGSLTSITCNTEIVDENWNSFCSVEKTVTISMNTSYQANLNAAHIDNDESLSYNADVPVFHDDRNISPIYTDAPADESQMFDSADEENSYATQDNPISYTKITDAIPTGYDSKAVEKNAPKGHGKKSSIVYNNQEKIHNLTAGRNYPENLLSVFNTSNNIDNHVASSSLETSDYARNLIDVVSLNSERIGSGPSITYNHPVNIRRKDEGGQEIAMVKN